MRNIYELGDCFARSQTSLMSEKSSFALSSLVARSSHTTTMQINNIPSNRKVHEMPKLRYVESHTGAPDQPNDNLKRR